MTSQVFASESTRSTAVPRPLPQNDHLYTGLISFLVFQEKKGETRQAQVKKTGRGTYFISSCVNILDWAKKKLHNFKHFFFVVDRHFTFLLLQGLFETKPVLFFSCSSNRSPSRVSGNSSEERLLLPLQQKTTTQTSWFEFGWHWFEWLSVRSCVPEGQGFEPPALVSSFNSPKKVTMTPCPNFVISVIEAQNRCRECRELDCSSSEVSTIFSRIINGNSSRAKNVLHKLLQEPLGQILHKFYIGPSWRL